MFISSVPTFVNQPSQHRGAVLIVVFLLFLFSFRLDGGSVRAISNNSPKRYFNLTIQRWAYTLSPFETRPASRGNDSGRVKKVIGSVSPTELPMIHGTLFLRRYLSFGGTVSKTFPHACVTPDSEYTETEREGFLIILNSVAQRV